MSKSQVAASEHAAPTPELPAQPSDDFPRIAYFTESMLPWVDGVSRTLGIVFDALEAQSRDFRVFAPIAPSDRYAWSHRVTRLDSIPFLLYRDYRISIPNGRKLADELDAFAPDLIHICSPTPAGFWAQAYGRSRGIAVVGSFHTHFAAYFGYYRFGILRGAVWQTLRWFYNRCEATFAPSAGMIRELREHGIRNNRLWSRGVDTSLFDPARRDEALRAELGADDETVLLLLVSRLVKEKDLLELGDVDRALSASGLNYRFAIVGDGPLRKRLEKRLPGAYFAGAKWGEELARWYASADVFVFPSTTEAFGNVVQEAMASGLPSVVANSGGPPGVIVPDVTGLIAKAHDPADFARKSAVLILDAALRREMGRRGRELMVSRSWDEVTNGLLCDYALIRDRVRRGARRPRGRSWLTGAMAGFRRRRHLAGSNN